MIDAQWTTPEGAAHIAAANLIGYLLGALIAHRVALKCGSTLSIRVAMLLALFSFAACSINLGLTWFWMWRFAAGVSGGLLMILAAPYVLRQIPASMRGKAAGFMFSGVGWGIVVSGITVPAFGTAHLGSAWLVLAAAMALSAALSWPRYGKKAPDTTAHTCLAEGRPGVRGALLALLCAYSLDAVAYLPHTVFWVEYLVHDLGHPPSTSGAYWAIFGVGAAFGPTLCGYIADRLGFRVTLISCLILKGMAVGLPLLSTSSVALFASSLLVGALSPGMATLVSGRAIEIAGVSEYLRYWALLTFSFSVMQAAGGYAMAALYASTHSFTSLFGTGAILLFIAAIPLSLKS